VNVFSGTAFNRSWPFTVRKKSTHLLVPKGSRVHCDEAKCGAFTFVHNPHSPARTFSLFFLYSPVSQEDIAILVVLLSSQSCVLDPVLLVF